MPNRKGKGNGKVGKAPKDPKEDIHFMGSTPSAAVVEKRAQIIPPFPGASKDYQDSVYYRLKCSMMKIEHDKQTKQLMDDIKSLQLSNSNVMRTYAEHAEMKKALEESCPIGRAVAAEKELDKLYEDLGLTRIESEHWKKQMRLGEKTIDRLCKENDALRAKLMESSQEAAALAERAEDLDEELDDTKKKLAMSEDKCKLMLGNRIQSGKEPIALPN